MATTTEEPIPEVDVTTKNSEEEKKQLEDEDEIKQMIIEDGNEMNRTMVLKEEMERVNAWKRFRWNLMKEQIKIKIPNGIINKMDYFFLKEIIDEMNIFRVDKLDRKYIDK